MRGLVIAAIVLAGAGCKKTLHFRVVEDELHAKLGADAPMSGADCDETEVHEGATFACHLTFKDGGKTDVHVTLQDTLGSWSMREKYFAASRAAALIQERLRSKRNIAAEIDCGKDLLFSGHHRCTAHAQGMDDGAIDFYVNDDGDATWKFVE